MKKFISLLITILSIQNIFAVDKSIQNAKEEYKSLLTKKYVLLPHRGNFLIPISYNFNPNNKSYESITNTEGFENRGDFNEQSEAEFQISFLVLTAKKILNTDYNLFAGYTHQSWWQLYNNDWSRPFRETNYSPEIFARKFIEKSYKFLGGNLIGYDIGFIHQSNGQIQELSKSWNRVFFRFATSYGKTILSTSLWYRIPESKDKDDNPDIYDYIGYGEFELSRMFGKSRLRIRLVPGMKHQGTELTYSYPWTEGVRFFTKIGYGYGLSLIDYKNETQKIGIGFTLTDLLSADKE